MQVCCCALVLRVRISSMLLVLVCQYCVQIVQGCV
jgi:hypothetical protein